MRFHEITRQKRRLMDSPTSTIEEPSEGLKLGCAEEELSTERFGLSVVTEFDRSRSVGIK